MARGDVLPGSGLEVERKNTSTPLRPRGGPTAQSLATITKQTCHQMEKLSECISNCRQSRQQVVKMHPTEAKPYSAAGIHGNNAISLWSGQDKRNSLHHAQSLIPSEILGPFLSTSTECSPFILDLLPKLHGFHYSHEHDHESTPSQ